MAVAPPAAQSFSTQWRPGRNLELVSE
jgi:hypothetical protein